MMRSLLTVAVALLLAASLLGYLADLWWFFDLFSHFRLQYLFLLSTCLLLILISRAWALATPCLLALLLNLYLVAPYIVPPGDDVKVNKQILYKLISSNIHFANSNYSKLADYLQKADADLVLLSEFTPLAKQQLSKVIDSYPHKILDSRPDPYGIALLSRFPLTASASMYLANIPLPAIETLVDTPSGKLHFIGVHLDWPFGAQRTFNRDAQLLALGEKLSRTHQPGLAIGDFNTTPWSRGFRTMMSNYAISDGSINQGIYASWPSYFPLAGIPIDHVLTSNNVVISKRLIGEGAGSDHWPLVVEFILP